MPEENDQIAAIYNIYPRKVGKLVALKSIQKAVSHLVQSDKISALDARRKLYRATLLYARSPIGQQQDKSRIPHPSTWFNQGRYLDDPSEWQHVGGFDRGNVPAGKATGNLGVLAGLLGARKHDDRAHQDGELPASQHRPGSDGKLLSGPQGS